MDEDNDLQKLGKKYLENISNVLAEIETLDKDKFKESINTTEYKINKEQAIATGAAFLGFNEKFKNIDTRKFNNAVVAKMDEFVASVKNSHPQLTEFFIQESRYIAKAGVANFFTVKNQTRDYLKLMDSKLADKFDKALTMPELQTQKVTKAFDMDKDKKDKEIEIGD